MKQRWATIMAEAALVKFTGSVQRVIGRNNGALDGIFLAELSSAVLIHGILAEEFEQVLDGAAAAMGMETIERRECTFFFIGQQDSGGFSSRRVLIGPRADNLILALTGLLNGHGLRPEKSNDIQGAEIAIVLFPPLVGYCRTWAAGTPWPRRV